MELGCKKPIAMMDGYNFNGAKMYKARSSVSAEHHGGLIQRNQADHSVLTELFRTVHQTLDLLLGIDPAERGVR